MRPKRLLYILQARLIGLRRRAGSWKDRLVVLGRKLAAWKRRAVAEQRVWKRRALGWREDIALRTLRVELRARELWLGIRGRARALRSPRVRRRLSRRILWALLRLSFAVVFPFWLLMASSVLLHARYGTGPWIALSAGIGLTTLLLMGYAAWVTHRLTGRTRVGRPARRLLPAVVTGYCLYALIYLSAANAKTEDLRAEYRSLHPLLRVAVGTLVLFDDRAVITDMARHPEDYAAMGLPVNPVSPHYRQPDGYAYAVDLRTRDRAWWKNLLMEGYFRAIGFSTLRHIGTADHLHVSLPAARIARGREAGP